MKCGGGRLCGLRQIHLKQLILYDLFHFLVVGAATRLRGEHVDNFRAWN